MITRFPSNTPKRNDIAWCRLANEIVGIRLNPVKQGRGQPWGRLYIGGFDIFGHNAGIGAVLFPDVDKIRFQVRRNRVMINDDVKNIIAEYLIMGRLGIQQHPFGYRSFFQRTDMIVAKVEEVDECPVVRPFNAVN
jgi:hypothetical protein